MVGGWELVFDLLVALGAALVLGIVFERLRMNAIVGYLLAGVVAGPGALGLVQQTDQVKVIAEIGVALLLFTIGLEFSWGSLRRLGSGVLLGGVTMILACLLVFMGAALAFGVDWRGAFVLGAAVAMSSTAMMIRVLREQADLDTAHGKTVLGISLVQDLAVVPLFLFVSFAADTSGNLPVELSLVTGAAVALVLGLTFLVNYVVPRLLPEKIVAKNRELPIILAIVICVGSSWAARQMGLSPALGAFLAGMLLADSKFSHQMRADVFPLRTLFLTVFFVSVGLLADLRWITSNMGLVLGLAVAVIGVKTAIGYLALRPFIRGIVPSLASSVSLSHIGEFSFVLLILGSETGLLSPVVFQAAVSVTLVTLFVTPSMVSRALPISNRLARSLFPRRKLAKSERELKASRLRGHLVVIGYGEAGQSTCEALLGEDCQIVVVDLDPRLVALAETHGYRAFIGDASNHEILDHVRLVDARAVLVTVSDHNVARMVVGQCKSVAPRVPLLVRSRYHIYSKELDMVGADTVVDEELLVGRRMAEKLIAMKGEGGRVQRQGEFVLDGEKPYA